MAIICVFFTPKCVLLRFEHNRVKWKEHKHNTEADKKTNTYS